MYHLSTHFKILRTGTKGCIGASLYFYSDTTSVAENIILVYMSLCLLVSLQPICKHALLLLLNLFEMQM